MRGLGIRCLGLLLLTCSTALAAPTDQERAAARSLATEGISAFEAGRTAEATDKLERAWQLAAIPTIGLWSARALEKSGKLVEANERLMAVGRFEMTRGEPEVFAQAKTDAEQMQSTLASRIPQLKVELTNASGVDAAVELDGAPLKSALIGVQFQINPGKHTLSARAGARHVDRSVTIAERETARVALDVAPLRAPTTPGTVVPTDAATPSGASPAATAIENPPVEGSHPAHASGTSGKHIAGYIVLAVGGAGLITGGILGAKAIEQHSLYEDRCPKGQCSTEYQNYYDTYQSNQLFAIVSGSIGVVAVGAGLYLLLSGDSASSEQASVRPWIGWQSVGAVGRF